MDKRAFVDVSLKAGVTVFMKVDAEWWVELRDLWLRREVIPVKRDAGGGLVFDAQAGFSRAPSHVAIFRGRVFYKASCWHLTAWDASRADKGNWQSNGRTRAIFNALYRGADFASGELGVIARNADKGNWQSNGWTRAIFNALCRGADFASGELGVIARDEVAMLAPHICAKCRAALKWLVLRSTPFFAEYSEPLCALLRETQEDLWLDSLPAAQAFIIRQAVADWQRYNNAPYPYKEMIMNLVRGGKKDE